MLTIRTYDILGNVLPAAPAWAIPLAVGLVVLAMLGWGWNELQAWLRRRKIR